jgi:hypothetical protein
MRGLARLAGISIVVVLALGLAGCGNGGDGGVDNGGDFVRPSIPGNGAQAWPSAMPADIPYFPGHLDTFMPQRRQSGDSYGVRMFFTGVTQAQFQAYLDELKTAGYTLQPKVYYQEPDTEEHAKERAARGDYDAWVATKPPRVLTLTVPGPNGGEITFDVDGLTKAESDALPGLSDYLSGHMPSPTPMPSVGWPIEWAGTVPAPEGCYLGANGIVTSSPKNLYIACGYPDADPQHHQAVLNAYQAKLLAAGFAQTEGSSTTMIVYEKGPITVVLMTTDQWMAISATER